MQITEMLAQVGGLEAVARDLGVSEADAKDGSDALVPCLLHGLRKRALAEPKGLEGLDGLLAKLGGDSLLGEVLAPAPTNVEHGNEVLGELFGSKDVSRAVAQKVSETSRLSPALLRKMLPLLAMLVTGFMAKQVSNDEAAVDDQEAGGLGSVLGGLLGGNSGNGSGGGMGALMAMLDADDHGNPLDDIMAAVNRRK